MNCRCGHDRDSHTPERTGQWLVALGPNTATCRVCTCARYRKGDETDA